jgi:DNA-binding winged helix-turn-helix (wHTH) protein/tetratricopeptide (TPR) repeat protein
MVTQRLGFEEYELDPVNHVLLRNGEVVKLAPQPFKILVLLTERPGTLVTRAALREAVWGDETIVDFERGLNTCIRQIRHALGDNAEVPRFIETVPRLGYRFTAPVKTMPESVSPPRRWRILTTAAAIVAAAVGVAIAGAVLRGARPSDAVASEARELYLRGQLALADPNVGSARAALELFEKALALDPDYAAAHAGVAHAYLVRPPSLPSVSPEVAVLRAQIAIERALTLDESLPEAYLAAAQIHMVRLDWPAAGNEFRRAIEVAPDHSIARQRYAMWLSYQGRFEEAIREARLGESLDPLSVQARNTVAEVLRHARRCWEAVPQAQRALELNPHFGRAHSILAHCYFAEGRLEAAIEEYRRSSGTTGGNLGAAYARAGRTDEARRILESLEERYALTRGSAGEIAQVYVGLGEFDRALEWLTRAVDDGGVWTLKVAVVWDPLRSDPRFDALLLKSGLKG